MLGDASAMLDCPENLSFENLRVSKQMGLVFAMYPVSLVLAIKPKRGPVACAGHNREFWCLVDAGFTSSDRHSTMNK